MTKKEQLQENNRIKLTPETFNPDDFVFVDLGLPSGTLWATENAPGYYQFDEAVAVFGNNLPKAWKLVELYEECSWEWNEDKKGYFVIGPNDNAIFLPATGWMDWDESTGQLNGALISVGSYGHYWPFAPYSKASARCLSFYSGAVYPLSTNNRANGFAVRPSRESY